MKKCFMMLVALFMMIVIPWSVNADSGKLIDQTECETKTVKDNKITTCAITIKNESEVEFVGGNLTIPFVPNNPSTTVAFEVNTANAKEVSKNENTYEVQVEPIAAGSSVVIGTVTWKAKASLTDADCGGKYNFVWKGANSQNTQGTEGTGNVATGYSIPYVALALGVIGVITVIANSKKKTKMYKI